GGDEEHVAGAEGDALAPDEERAAPACDQVEFVLIVRRLGVRAPRRIVSELHAAVLHEKRRPGAWRDGGDLGFLERGADWTIHATSSCRECLGLRPQQPSAGPSARGSPPPTRRPLGSRQSAWACPTVSLQGSSTRTAWPRPARSAATAAPNRPSIERARVGTPHVRP